MYNSQFMNSEFIFSIGLTRDFFEHRMEMYQVILLNRELLLAKRTIEIHVESKNRSGPDSNACKRHANRPLTRDFAFYSLIRHVR